MKPLQIGLLILVGALGGALIMRFTQDSAPAPVPIVEAPVPAVPPAPVKAMPVAETESSPVAAQPEAIPEPPEPAPVKAPRVQKAHHPKHAKHSSPLPPPRKPEVAVVAQNHPPETPVPQPPAPAPVPEAQSNPPAEPAPVLIPAPETPQQPEQAPVPPPAPTVTLKSGMLLPVRLGEALSSDHNQSGDTFTATLDAPLAADGFVIAERGARLEGRVVEAQKSGRVKGQSVLGLELTFLNTSDGQRVAIKTETFRKVGAARSPTENVGIVAAAAGIGAVIGAIAGGGKGAGIGAAVGGVAGAGGVAATRATAASLGSETQVRFRLVEPVTLTERISY